MRRSPNVRVGRISLLLAHLVSQASFLKQLGHLFATPELAVEIVVQPRLVDLQTRIGQQPVTVKSLDVIALVSTPIPPNLYLIALHGLNQHRAGDGSANGRGIEIRNPGRGDVECPALQSRKPFMDQLLSTIDQPCQLRPTLHGPLGDVVVIGFVGLTEIRGVTARNRSLGSHPIDRCTGVQSPRKGDPYAFADR